MTKVFVKCSQGVICYIRLKTDTGLPNRGIMSSYLNGQILFSKAYTVLPCCQTQSFVDSGKLEAITVLQHGEEGRLFQHEILLYIRLNRCIGLT